MDLDKYGVPGVIAMILIAAIVWCTKYIKDLNSEHKQEREEWRKTIDRQFDDANRNSQRQADEYLKVTKEHTSVLSELSTILKSKK